MIESVELLLPPPREVATPEGGFPLPERPTLVADAVATETPRRLVAEALVAEMTALGIPPRTIPSADADIRLDLDPGVGAAESYRLTVGPRGITVRGADPAGLFYGTSTLAQWLRIHRDRDRVPFLRIVDRPAFRHRGVMLDISRDKVPTLDTLRGLIDLLAGWKINQLQLYMEHTFAYRGHEEVWRDASPLTASEVRELDAYCRARFIELVPNQNSFGHLHRWLIHQPYRPLAESPEGIEHPFSFERQPFSLCPIDPRGLELLAGLYDQLLPCFTSRTFNVGLDEILDLGFGRSAAACAEHGKGRVYLDFLRQVHQLVAKRGLRMQFWGDIILRYPELLAELPEDAIALEWGYESDHPFDRDTRSFAASGLDFYVCPGTSSWNSFAGRSENAVLNLASAAIHGDAQGALGYLIADWGDHGHLQPLPVSYPGFAAGAAFSWNVAAARKPRDLPLGRWLDLHVFRDRARVTGGVTRDLGNAYLQTGAEAENGSPLFFALLYADRPSAERRGQGMTVASLRRTLDHIERAVAPLSSARMERPDAELIRRELGWAADLSRFACRLAAARLEAGDEKPLSALPARRAFARRIDELIETHREIWLARNRPGGLDDSAGQLRRLKNLFAT